jgi:hypothetical protein
MAAQYVEIQQGVHESVKVVVERLVTRCSEIVDRKVSFEHLTGESVDVDQFIVPPARRNVVQEAEAQTPGKEEKHDDESPLPTSHAG